MLIDNDKDQVTNPELDSSSNSTPEADVSGLTNQTPVEEPDQSNNAQATAAKGRFVSGQANASQNDSRKNKGEEIAAAYRQIFSPMDQYFLDDNYDKTQDQSLDLDQVFKEIANRFKIGSLVSGKVVEKENRGVLVSINYKSDGFIPAYEFSGFELSKTKAGDDLEVMIESLEDADGNLVLSYQKAKSIRVWNEVTELYEKGGTIVGRITYKVKGGLSVDIGIPAFLPGSQIDVVKVTDFDQYVGMDVACKIIKINRKRGNVIVSRRAFVEEERNEVRRKSLGNLEEGQVIRGTVKNITSYGAFVDIGGIDGLLHITDMSWGRISHPSEAVKIGDEISVKILSFDKDNAKISLGIKQLYENPWQDVDNRFKVGGKISGKIAAITDYGVFVELAPGVEGLVHISEISWTERVQDLQARYKVGSTIDVMILGIERSERRISLSIKRLDNDPWKVAFDKFKIGDKVKGVVSNVTDFGVFVRINPGVDGLVHVSDISWTDHIDSPKDHFKRGDEVSVVILAVEEEKHRISLGMKQVTQDPWENVEKDFPMGSLVSGVVSKVTNFGVFVRFPSGIEGLAYVSELSSGEIQDLNSFLPVGVTETFKVIKSSASERKLGLSLKAVKEPEAESSYSHHQESNVGSFKNNSTPTNFGDSSDNSAKGSLQLALEKIKKARKNN